MDTSTALIRALNSTTNVRTDADQAMRDILTALLDAFGALGEVRPLRSGNGLEIVGDDGAVYHIERGDEGKTWCYRWARADARDSGSIPESL